MPTLPIPIYLPLLSHVDGEADGQLDSYEPLGCGILGEGSGWDVLWTVYELGKQY